MNNSSSDLATINLSAKSSCETIIIAQSSENCSNSNVFTSNTQLPSPRGIFRQRTFDTKSQPKLLENSPRKIMVSKRSNTTNDLKAISCPTVTTCLSNKMTKLENYHQPHNRSNNNPIKCMPTKMINQKLPPVHKLGTIPSYLNRSSICTMESTFAIKYKQYKLKKIKFYEQQKMLMNEYRILLEMNEKCKQRNGKHTKLEPLNVIEFKLNDFHKCLCMSSECSEIELALNEAEEILWKLTDGNVS